MSKAIHNLNNGTSQVSRARQFGGKWGSIIGMTGLAIAAVALAGPAGGVFLAGQAFMDLMIAIPVGAVGGAVGGSLAAGTLARASNIIPSVKGFGHAPVNIMDHPRAMQAHRIDPVNAREIDTDKFNKRAGNKSISKRHNTPSRRVEPLMAKTNKLYHPEQLQKQDELTGPYSL